MFWIILVKKESCFRNDNLTSNSLSSSIKISLLLIFKGGDSENLTKVATTILNV